MGAAREGWLVLPDPDMDLGGEELDRMDDLRRMLFHFHVEEAIVQASRLTLDPNILYELGSAYNALRHYRQVTEAVIARHEGKVRHEPFRLLHRQLSGMAVQFSSFASHRPEQTCSAFKAQQVNAVLRPLKALLEEDALMAGTDLPLVSKAGEHTCSDVLFLLQNWLDVCADFAIRHYDGTPPSNPPVTRTYHPEIIRLIILDFCMDEPKTLLEIGKTLGYRDKKTIHKYVDPLLAEGCLARTIPDKPCSRSQRYITVKYK